MTISDYEYERVACGLTKKYRRRFTAQEVKNKFWVIGDRKGITFINFGW